jgi:hypothetical protein
MISARASGLLFVAAAVSEVFTQAPTPPSGPTFDVVMEVLARMLRSPAGRRVVDKTGLSGSYRTS